MNKVYAIHRNGKLIRHFDNIRTVYTNKSIAEDQKVRIATCLAVNKPIGWYGLNKEEKDTILNQTLSELQVVEYVPKEAKDNEQP